MWSGIDMLYGIDMLELINKPNHNNCGIDMLPLGLRTFKKRTSARIFFNERTYFGRDRPLKIHVARGYTTWWISMTN